MGLGGDQDPGFLAGSQVMAKLVGGGPHSSLQGDRIHCHQIPSCHPRLTESHLMRMGLKNDVLTDSLGNSYAF